MMEIERRFLCRITDLSALHKMPSSHIRQAYLTTGDPAVRIRERGGEHLMTIKTGRGLVRREVEFPVPSSAAAELLEIAGEHSLEKTRFHLDRWEVDIFEGRLSGLVLAEVELDDIDEPTPPAPPGIELVREVTDEASFTNQALATLEADLIRRIIEEVQELA